MKYFFILFFPLIAFSQEQLNLHLECKDGGNCVTLEGNSGPQSVVKTPSMTLDKNNLRSVSVVAGEYGNEEISINMGDEAAKEFAALTEANVGKQLAIVLNRKILMAPNIQSAILGGSLRITLGIGKKGSDFLNEAPWLKAMADQVQSAEANAHARDLFIYVLAGIILIGGAIVFVFRSKSSES